MSIPPARENQTAPEIRAINAGLRGPVIDAIKACVPELREVGRDELYERVMDTPALGDLCFKAFRANPIVFAPLMIGAQGRKVTADDQPLSCGRTTAQVIAMIVRAMARRYFRATLNGGQGVKSESPTDDLEIAERIARSLGLARQWHDGSSRRGRTGAKSVVLTGDLIFRELRDFLLYEWQAILIPEYALIPASLARHVAPYIVAARDAADVRALIAAAKAPVAAIAAKDGRRIARPGDAPSDQRSWQP
jgi:hypothetical protein